MDSTKQRLNKVLTEEVDRATFLKRTGLLILAVFGIARFLHLDLTAPQAQAQAPTDTKEDDIAAAHARAMAVASMRL